MKDFRWPIGIELTGVPWQLTKPLAYYELVDEHHRSLKRQLLHLGINPWSIHVDDHCVEIPTRKATEWAKISHDIQGIRRVLNKNGYYPKHPLVVCGGAHVHVEIKDVRLKLWMVRDLIGRPYLPWVFGEPDDTESMVGLNGCWEEMDRELMRRIETNCYGGSCIYNSYNSYNFHNKVLEILDNEHPEEVILPAIYPSEPLNARRLHRNISNKDYMVVLSDLGTIEFRFFEMAPNWAEQVLQLKWLWHYLEWAYASFVAGKRYPVRLLTSAQLQSITPSQAWDCFSDHCRTIGINPSEYAVFRKRNLLPRWQLGRERN